MNPAICTLALLIFPAFGLGWESAAPQAAIQSFPGPDFVLRDTELQPQKSGAVLGPMESNGTGGAKGAFVIYGASSFIEVGEPFL